MDPHNPLDASHLVAGPTVNVLIGTTESDAIVTDAPKERFRLGFFSTACLVINCMVGTGIFNSPTTVIRGTKSTGGALLLWFFGIFYGLSGLHVYIEYGLNVPRFVIDGVEQAVPRSGGTLHYIQYVYRWIYYKRDTVLLSGCLYGISSICLQNMASNCLAFAARVLQAARPHEVPDKGQVRGIALVAAAFACVVHSVSRRGGIWLSNFFTCVKLGILGLIIGTTLAVVGGGIKDKHGAPVPNVFIQNTFYETAFQPPRNATADANVQLESGAANGYAAAFLAIIFSYNGFGQASYVLGEIASPRRTFPRATTFAVALVSVLYMVVNICYMAVVPAFEQLQGDSVVALLFFRKVFGWVGNDIPDRIFNAFLALSSFGNIIVMTYTAARMKQEIAKQGFIPFAKFFGQNTDISIGRFVLHLRKRGWNLRWISAQQHQEPTPVGALILQFVGCVVLILATYNATVDDAYDLLAKMLAYLIVAWFGVFVAAGILILRIFGPPDTRSAETTEHPGPAALGDNGSPNPNSPVRRTWSKMTEGTVYGWLSVVCAVLYLVGNLFPVIASWIPSTATFDFTEVAWWVVPTVSWAVLGFAAVWWLGFLAVAKYREHHQQKDFVYEIRPAFDWADPAGEEGVEDSGREKRRRDGGKILAHETVVLAWVGREMDMFTSGVDHQLTTLGAQPGSGARLTQRQSEIPSPVQDANHFAGTDFDGFGPAMQSQVAIR